MSYLPNGSLDNSKYDLNSTSRPKPEEVKPAWMDNEKANKLKELPDDFPRDYKSWGQPGTQNAHLGGI